MKRYLVVTACFLALACSDNTARHDYRLLRESHSRMKVITRTLDGPGLKAAADQYYLVKQRLLEYKPQTENEDLARAYLISAAAISHAVCVKGLQSEPLNDTETEVVVKFTIASSMLMDAAEGAIEEVEKTNTGNI